ncbi:hypothetical protein P167DRAFT_36070 [Morchella conica CCBAS932]|uniref:Uncharacterized protein n=1 Tax=Morchella conica CCBAS932 TaxID=1392247 RepID=A0A3N4KEL6_9PEZI|nr:hypothetical protein P167DRAFT_36070 [Morchella conica CCBAS932]
MGVAYSSHPRDALELRVGCGTGGFVDHLRKKRSEGLWRGREIDVQEVTPSAVTTVLMSTVLNEYADTFPFDIWVLRRHLSDTAFYGMRVENPSLLVLLLGNHLLHSEPNHQPHQREEVHSGPHKHPQAGWQHNAHLERPALATNGLLCPASPPAPA